MSALGAELRAALHTITARPAFSALVVGVLAAGLACVIFMLMMINGFVVKPLPFAAPDALLHAGVRDSNGGADLDDVDHLSLLTLRQHLADVAEVAGFNGATLNLSDLQRPERFDGAFVSANLWHVLGVAPLLGRDFNPGDERPGAASVVMLSWELWQSRYGGDPAILDREVRLNARPARVIGVMPRDFSYPFRETVWTAAPLGEATAANDDGRYTVVLRRAAGITDAAVETALQGWFDDAAKARPEEFRGQRPGLQPLAYLAVNETTRAMLGLMFAAVLSVLLVACANAANLLLTRTLGRGQELALRVALGASRARIALHLLAQSLLLSALALAIALPLACLGMANQAAVLRDTSSGPPRWLHFELDAGVIGMALAAALLTALVTGILPALRGADHATAGALRSGARSIAGGAFARISRVLVVGEVALSCALLIGVGTMVRGVAALDHLDMGIDPQQLLTARLALFADAYPDDAAQLRLYQRLGESLRADPEVSAASVATVLPARYSTTHDIAAAGVAVVEDMRLPHVQYGATDDDFLAAYRIALQEGRFFDGRDRADGERVAVVDRQFAERFGDEGSVLGRRFRLDPRDPKGATFTVIGITARLKLGGPADISQPSVLVPLRQAPARFVSLAIRTRGDALAFAPRLNEIMRQLDADTPLYWVRDYHELIRSVTFGERILAQWFGIFGLIALALAAAGLYGVVAFNVGQRTREIGVRRALGAPSSRVLRSVLAHNAAQLGGGLLLGLLLGVPFARGLTGWLHSIESVSAGVIGVALAVLLLAAALAVLVPTRRALRVDPTVALRHE